jgi:acyl transferase domain-containing protein
MKVILALHHGVLPRHLHFQTLNPRIRLDGTPFAIPTSEVAWERGSAPRIAGVSSFGISGTNAHVVVEEAPAPAAAAPSPPPERPICLPLSARSRAALLALCEDYRALLTQLPAAALPALADTASRRRSHHPERIAVVGRTPPELWQKLAEQATTADPPPPAPTGHRLVFVFPGQGGQWLGMGRALAAAEPAFRAALAECEEAMRPYVGWSLQAELAADPAVSRLGEIDVVQPVLWAFEVALAALWRSWGVEPDVVVGHSMGEVAAAQVAGILTPENAARVICRRSALLRRVSGRGAMALVELSLTEAEQALAGYKDKLSIAASNGPRATVLSGDAAALAELLLALEQGGIFCRRVKVDVASHSPEVAELLPELRRELAGLAPARARLPMRSTVTGETVEGPELDGEYWARNLRQPVRFAAAVDALSRDTLAAFVELSPHPILLPAIADGLAATRRPGVLVPTLRREEDEPLAMAEAVAALYRAGRRIDWHAFLGHPPPQPPSALPLYPWQRERFWLDPAPPAGERSPTEPRPGQHPLLGEPGELASEPEVRLFTHSLSRQGAPYLTDHCVGAAVVLPAAAYVEMALAAGELHLGAAVTLHALRLVQPLVLPQGDALTVQLVLQLGPGARAAFEVHSKTADGWLRHAQGELRARPADPDDALGAPPPLEQPAPVHRLPATEHYARLAASGLAYGPLFQAVDEVRCSAQTALGRVRLPPGAPTEASAAQVILLDGCFQVLAALAGERPGVALLPVGIERLRRHRPLAPELLCRVALRPAGEDADRAVVTADLTIHAAGDAIDQPPVAEVSGLTLRRVGLGGSEELAAAGASFHDLVWRPVPAPPPAARRPRRYFLITDGGGVGAALHALLVECGDAVVVLRPGDRALAARLAEAPPDGILYLGALDAVARPDSDAAALRMAFAASCTSALELVQTVAAAGLRDAPRLFLITAGSQVAMASDRGCAVAQTPLWGFGRTLMHEHPELACKLIDLPFAATAAGVDPAALPELLLELERDDARIRWRCARAATRWRPARATPRAWYIRRRPPRPSLRSSGPAPASGRSA